MPGENFMEPHVAFTRKNPDWSVSSVAQEVEMKYPMKGANLQEIISKSSQEIISKQNPASPAYGKGEADQLPPPVCLLYIFCCISLINSRKRNSLAESMSSSDRST